MTAGAVKRVNNNRSFGHITPLNDRCNVFANQVITYDLG